MALAWLWPAAAVLEVEEEEEEEEDVFVGSGTSRTPCALTTKAALLSAELLLFSNVAQRSGGESWPKLGPAPLLLATDTVSVPAAAAAATAAVVQCSMTRVCTQRV